MPERSLAGPSPARQRRTNVGPRGARPRNLRRRAAYPSGAGRLPLRERVCHDGVVSRWCRGDCDNKLPAFRDRRDLVNALYGTPPMLMFRRDWWRANRERFAGSRRAATPVARATGCSEMTDHRFLAPDRSVQETRFANGVRVTASFGPGPHRLPDGGEAAPMSSRVEGVR